MIPSLTRVFSGTLKLYKADHDAVDIDKFPFENVSIEVMSFVVDLAGRLLA